MEENEKHWPPAPQGILPAQNVGRGATSLTSYFLLDGVLGFSIGLLGLSISLVLMSALVYGLLPFGDTEPEYIKHQEPIFCGWIPVTVLFAMMCWATARRLKVFGIASAIGGFIVIAVLTWYYSDWLPIIFFGAPLSSARSGG